MSPVPGFNPGMKWFAPSAGLFLALAWVHFAFVASLGGNPAWVVGWLVLFVATGGVALAHTLTGALPARDFGETMLIRSADLKRRLLAAYRGPLLVPLPRLKAAGARGLDTSQVYGRDRTATRAEPLRSYRG
ncbi:MAG: hypothetical protein JNK82_25925 [Myxococcaceae bacterium]|nr:hypothetical protein [Myxococcaceae bacterium]